MRLEHLVWAACSSDASTSYPLKYSSENVKFSPTGEVKDTYISVPAFESMSDGSNFYNHPAHHELGEQLAYFVDPANQFRRACS